MNQQISSEWNQFQQKHINTPPLIVYLIINSIYNTLALINSSYLYYALVSKKFARYSRLERYTITPQTIEGIDSKLLEIKKISKFEFNMHSY